MFRLLLGLWGKEASWSLGLAGFKSFGASDPDEGLECRCVGLEV